MRRAAIGILVASVLAAAGCGEALKADRDVAPADLALALEAVGLQPEGGLPAKVRLTVRNRSAATVVFTLPRPLVTEEAGKGRDEPPLPLMLLALRDAQGHDEMPVYTDIRARRWPQARKVAIGPGREWSGEYPIEAFYFWGPCGPDTGGSFGKYFWRGQTEVRVSAVLMLGKDRTVESEPIVLRCTFEDWLFREKRGLPSS